MASWKSLSQSLLRAGVDALSRTIQEQTRSKGRRHDPDVPSEQRPPHGPNRQRPKAPRADDQAPPPLSDAYPGDFTGIPQLTYSPAPGDLPDPGEVVWTWVPYEEDHSQGKDRPALLVGRDGDWLLALPLTSKDHDRDKGQEASQGRYWVDLGVGDWDPRRRPSEARVDRIVRVNPAGVRRIGSQVDQATFDRVAAAVRQHSS